MTKRNAALEAIGKAPVLAPAANVVSLPHDAQPVPAAPAANTSRAGVKTEDRAKVMLYLHPKVARKFKEMAFTEDRKLHDVYLDALDLYLTQQGHGGLKGVTER